MSPTLRIVRDPDSLADQLRASLDALTDPRLFFHGACVRCGLTRDEHTPMRPLMACALAVYRGMR